MTADAERPKHADTANSHGGEHVDCCGPMEQFVHDAAPLMDDETLLRVLPLIRAYAAGQLRAAAEASDLCCERGILARADDLDPMTAVARRHREAGR